MIPLRYVVLRHEGIAEPHFDLMVEHVPGAMLTTWRSERWPIEETTPLTRLRDHRRLYLAYEGEISERRGSVFRIAEGNCEVDVGPDDVWTVRLITGTFPQQFRIHKIQGDQWEAQPL